ncbi:MAG: hypothetical protein ACP5XB_03000 [Isosphaeraceae bacterium]
MKARLVCVSLAATVAIAVVPGLWRTARPACVTPIGSAGSDVDAPARKKHDKPAAPKPKPKPTKPLLLDDDDDAPEGPSTGADNSRCFVCHLNLKTEQIAATHARKSVGCARCHGASDAHIADESWASGGNGTAPDKMFPRDKINAFCQTCHDMSASDTKRKCKFPTLGATAAKAKVCTDCHGKHRLATRKCKWK